ncbi:ornithine carbamoyltransferase [Candidatus Poribacteria bacterium]|nr:ornithine carbamoyltransferase [Candidatus Poribacteria bacterium]MYF54247.1 ornithine carbamoyltransferase [Candidatus Poribacteria bacterium]
MHLITLKDWSEAEILETVENCIKIKNHPEKYRHAATGLSLALLFQKTSTRTRCAGEIGIVQLGGHAHYLDWRTTNFGLADLNDEIRVLSAYVDVILARFLKHKDISISGEAATVPIINGCCDRFHPTQALGDLMTIQEQLGRLEGVKVCFIGVHNNVCNSLITAGMKVGLEVTVIAPEINPAAVDVELWKEAERKGCYKTVSTDRIDDTLALQEVIAQNDVVYTDTWIDMEFFTDPDFAEERDRRIKLMMPYQLNPTLLAGIDCKVMHCLPAHRGYEISGEILDDPRSVIFVQSENRLHSMKAIILKLLA